MALFNELFKSSVGILSLFTIVFIIGMAIFLFFWVKKQADSSSPKN